MKARRALFDAERSPVMAPLALLVACALLVLMQLYVAIPLTPVVGTALGSGRAAAALGTAYSLSYALGLLIFGPLSDQYGRKVILVPGMGPGHRHGGPLCRSVHRGRRSAARRAGFVRGELRIGGAAVRRRGTPPALALHRRIGAVSTAFLVAGILGQVYAQAVARALGWRWVFGLAAPVFAVAVVGLATILVEPTRGRPRVD